jgi:aminoglycoside/choline kinase family phosphotransferase
MSSRGEQIEAFLKTEGWGSASRRRLAGDASFRRYERLRMGRESAVLMDAPPPQEDVRPFWALANYLNNNDCSAPHVLAGQIEAGFLLLEDLGDQTFNRTFAADPASEPALYEAAVELLVHLHGLSRPASLTYADGAPYRLAPYGEGALYEELLLLPEWYLPLVLGQDDPAWRPQLKAIWRPYFEELISVPEVLVLRDYHADNLIWLAKRDEARRVGVLDFQDALMGHPAYDLVSLLQDARRDLSPGLEAAMKERYLAAVSERGEAQDPETFERHYQLLGAQRNSKIIGIFTRLWQRDGKPQYLEMIPRVWGHLERNVAHPALAPYRKWLDRMIPGPMRRVAPPAGVRHDQ